MENAHIEGFGNGCDTGKSLTRPLPGTRPTP
jgi:hypothetical protein